ncbi:MAG: DUF427 domain-containing protein [Pseudomonadota bacterium]
MWNFVGSGRPEFAIEPGPGQESVWDFPRPPVAEPCNRAIRVVAGGTVLAEASTSYRLKETASPPTFYLPPSAVKAGILIPTAGQSFCEWKGAASYHALEGDPSTAVAWSYPNPSKAFSMLLDHVSFYPGRVECYVDGERVRPQAGGFYGGWITDDVVGPFKGDAGTGHW